MTKNQNETVKMPKLIGSATQSKCGSASLYTLPDYYCPFDATAPGMTPEKSLERAKLAAQAINQFEALQAVADAARVNQSSPDAAFRKLALALAHLQAVRGGKAVQS